MDDDSEPTSKSAFRRWRDQLQESAREAYQTNALLRHLIHEPLFSVALLLFLASALGVAVLLPKVWDPTPASFSKRVRVSLLDHIQAWSLRRAGDQAVRDQRWEDALARYRGALANNIADLRSLRGLLAILRDAPFARTANLRTLFIAAEFTREIGHTNRADALLIADVFERHRIADLALDNLRPWANELSPAEDVVWTRALLTSGQIEKFQAQLAAHPDHFTNNPVIEIYRAAVDAGWGGVEKAVAGLERLRAALDHPTERIFAARMLAAAALQRDDITTYEQALKTLRDSESTMAQDEAMWWELLARHGRAEEARTLAKSYDKLPPPTPAEAVQLARTWLSLGLGDLGLNLFKEHATSYGQSLEVWATYLDLLMLKPDWNEVRRVAALLRVNSSVRDGLYPVTLYADIRADLAEGRRNVVRESLQKLRSATLPGPQLTLRFAAGLNSAHEPDTARFLLSQIRTNLENSPDYWLEVVLANRSLRDAQGMKYAADRLAQLAPNHLAAQTIRLVTLLGTREEPAEALAISLRILGAAPPSDSTRINHAMALLLNRRASEALSFLDAVNSAQLTPDDLNSWRIARTDALAQLGRYGQALAESKPVDSSVLLPPQEEWFRDLLELCRTKSAGTPSPR